MSLKLEKLSAAGSNNANYKKNLNVFIIISNIKY